MELPFVFTQQMYILVKKKLKIGIVESIEHNKKSVKEARSTTGSVAVRIKGDVTAGR